MDNEALLFCKKTPLNRNRKWEKLDLVYIESIVGSISPYEYKMIYNTAKNNEIAIKAIKNKRASDEAYYDYMRQVYMQKKRDRYYRRSMNDLEEDNEERNY